VSNQFGKRLFNIFFKTYTEKVWGMSCKTSAPTGPPSASRGVALVGHLECALRVLSRKRRGSEQGHQDADRHLPLIRAGAPA